MKKRGRENYILPVEKLEENESERRARKLPFNIFVILFFLVGCLKTQEDHDESQETIF